MKNKKIGLWLNIVTICLSLCAIAVGVYSVKQTKLSISGAIGFTAYTNADVVCKVTGAKLASETSYSNKTYYITPDGVTTNSSNSSIKMTKDTKPLDFTGLSFAYNETTKEVIDMVFTFTITNTSADTIVADLNIDNLITNKVTSTVDNFVQIIRHSGDSLGGDSDQSVIGSATISLTLTLKENTDIENAVSGSMILNIQEQMDTTGFEVDVNNSDEYYLKTVPQVGTNTELVIPAYVYSSNNFIRIKNIGLGGDDAVTNINGYTSIVVSNGIINIKNNAFSYSALLQSLTLPASIENFVANGYSAYSIANSKNFKQFNLPQNIRFSSLGLSYSDMITDIIIPEGITGISFGYCSQLNITQLPKGIKDVWIRGSKVITDLNVPEGVVTICVGGCTNLKTISLPSTLTTLDIGAFSGCTSLTSLAIPKSVTYIAMDALFNCVQLTEITYLGTKAEWEAISKNESLGWNNATRTVHCTDGDLTIYSSY